MKKRSSTSKSKKLPAALARELEQWRERVKQQNEAGNTGTADHEKLARLESAAKKHLTGE